MKKAPKKPIKDPEADKKIIKAAENGTLNWSGHGEEIREGESRARKVIVPLSDVKDVAIDGFRVPSEDKIHKTENDWTYVKKLRHGKNITTAIFGLKLYPTVVAVTAWIKRGEKK